MKDLRENGLFLILTYLKSVGGVASTQTALANFYDQEDPMRHPDLFLHSIALGVEQGVIVENHAADIIRIKHQTLNAEKLKDEMTKLALLLEQIKNKEISPITGVVSLKERIEKIHDLTNVF